MPIKEVFKRSMVKQVIFQITFPNLFFLESKIGDFQLKVMKTFPQSALLFRRQIVFVDVGSNVKVEDIVDKNPADQGQTKIWQFKSTNSNADCTLNVTGSSLSIISQSHKTYNQDSPNKFRDTIELAVGSFLEITKIPFISRIGLRYINECPMPTSTKSFENYYNTNFPVKRFSIEDATEMSFKTTVKRDRYFLRLAESITKAKDANDKLILDFDGFSNETLAEQYLTTTDDLHNLILGEFEKMIKKPIYQYMKGEELES